MRISDWSSDVCSSDLQRRGKQLANLAVNLGCHRRLTRLAVSRFGVAVEIVASGVRQPSDRIQPDFSAKPAPAPAEGKILTEIGPRVRFDQAVEQGIIDRKSTRLNSSH